MDAQPYCNDSTIKQEFLFIFSVCYKELYEWSCSHYSEFWEEMWHFAGVKASQQYDEVTFPYNSGEKAVGGKLSVDKAQIMPVIFCICANYSLRVM